MGGMFLNSRVPYERYKEVLRDPYFVDKTMILKELVFYFGKRNRYCCITRPRRFGKTDEKERIFEGLAISKEKEYSAHLNQHDLIYIDFGREIKGCKSFAQYIERIEKGILEDLTAAYPDCDLGKSVSVWDVLQKIFEQTKNRFLFVMDEWDAVFKMPFVTEKEHKEYLLEYLLFLKCLLKDQPYVEFAYMTGVLPIVKYSSGSELNMFVEYDMVTAEKFSEYFGFSDAEVDRLYEIYRSEAGTPKFSREELRLWYDGYYTAAGNRLYNPRSVVLALTDGQLRNNWTSSGPYDELFYYIRNNIEDVRDDLVLMVSGERVAADIGQLAAVSMEIHSREQIYSAMVVYGLLTYEDGAVLIPNKELMDHFNELLLSK